MREVHYVSPAFERIWGRSAATLYANPQQWIDFTLPEDSERVVEVFVAVGSGWWCCGFLPGEVLYYGLSPYGLVGVRFDGGEEVEEPEGLALVAPQGDGGGSAGAGAGVHGSPPVGGWRGHALQLHCHPPPAGTPDGPARQPCPAARGVGQLTGYRDATTEQP
jgi:hypothetical protein